MARNVPRLTTDEEAEAFLDQDLSDLDFSQFVPVRFEFERTCARGGAEACAASDGKAAPLPETGPVYTFV